MKKIYIYQFDGSALSPMSALGFSESPEPPDGFDTYAVIESPEAERVYSIVAENVGWHDGIDGISHSAQWMFMSAFRELHAYDDIPFICKRRMNNGATSTPIEELSHRILNESL